MRIPPGMRIVALISTLTVCDLPVVAGAEGIRDLDSAESRVQALIQRLRIKAADRIVVAGTCAPAWRRNCHESCDGVYGLWCFWGTVCNPNAHKCEKTSP
jgi:hypothetical protein